MPKCTSRSSSRVQRSRVQKKSERPERKVGERKAARISVYGLDDPPEGLLILAEPDDIVFKKKILG